MVTTSEMNVERSGEKILVIDDDSAGQRGLRRMFETIGFELAVQEMVRAGDGRLSV
jgi:ActR/RegA family two-component response regulator